VFWPVWRQNPGLTLVVVLETSTDHAFELFYFCL